MRATWVAWLILALATCGGEAPIVPALPADALPGMESEVSTIGADALASDALDPSALAVLLDDAGYVSGRERTYAGPGDAFSLAVTRVLVFDEPHGADTYLAWLREHQTDLLGAVEPLDPLGLPGSPFLVVHLPGGCCPKAVPVYLSAWRRGSNVLFVQAAGREADAAAVEHLAAALDRVVSGAPHA